MKESLKDNSIEGMTGGLVEGEVFGYQDVGWASEDYIQARKHGDMATARKLVRNWAKEHNVYSQGDFRAHLMDYFRENPGWDPGDPQIESGKNIPNDLHALVADKVTENFSDVKFYRTTNSPLDTLFGIDGFFEFNGKIVTLDLTNNPHKQDARADKADIVLSAKDLYDQESMEKVASDIASILNTETIEVLPA